MAYARWKWRTYIHPPLLHQVSTLEPLVTKPLPPCALKCSLIGFQLGSLYRRHLVCVQQSGCAALAPLTTTSSTTTTTTPTVAPAPPPTADTIQTGHHCIRPGPGQVAPVADWIWTLLSGQDRRKAGFHPDPLFPFRHALAPIPPRRFIPEGIA